MGSWVASQLAVLPLGPLARVEHAFHSQKELLFLEMLPMVAVGVGLLTQHFKIINGCVLPEMGFPQHEYCDAFLRVRECGRIWISFIWCLHYFSKISPVSKMVVKSKPGLLIISKLGGCVSSLWCVIVCSWDWESEV